MTRFFCVVFVLVSSLFAILVPARAEDAGECTASYYKTKDSACLDAVVAGWRAGPAQQITQRGGVIGFVAAIFQGDPATRARVLRGETSPAAQGAEILALMVGGLTVEAKQFAEANRRTDYFDKLSAARITPLAQLRPSANPGDNDLLIGAYMASGDVAHINHILENFRSADDGMVADAIRFGLLAGKFGRDLTPKDREKLAVPALCEKYSCKANPAKLLRVMTLGTAFWALQSLGRKDEGVRKAFAAFFNGDPRLKGIAATEQNAFGNYITTLVAVVAIKTPNPEQAETFAALNKSLLVYEKFGPAADAFAPLRDLTKNKPAPAVEQK